MTEHKGHNEGDKLVRSPVGESTKVQESLLSETVSHGMKKVSLYQE